MTDHLKFSRGPNNTPIIEGEDERLIAFIETEILESVVVANDLLTMLKQSEDSDFHGNAHSVMIRKETATIESNFDDEAPDRRLDKEEFTTLIESWIHFISE